MHDLEKSVTPSESNTVFKPHYLQSDLDPFHFDTTDEPINKMTLYANKDNLTEQTT